MTSPYITLVEQIIQKQASVLGIAVAVRRARNVDGIVVDDSGKVTEVPQNAVAALESLVTQYKSLSGAMGVEFCRQAAATFRLAHAEIQLPLLLA